MQLVTLPERHWVRRWCDKCGCFTRSVVLADARECCAEHGRGWQAIEDGRAE
jgi:hypothetical protein